MKRIAKAAIHLTLLVTIAVGLFWLMSPLFPNFCRLLVTDPTWGILSVSGLGMIGLLIALELTSLIVVHLLYAPPFE